MFKVLRELSYCLNVLDPLITPLVLSFYLVKRFMITKNSVVKIQNLVMNHESRPVKSNPVIIIRRRKLVHVIVLVC